MAGEGEEVKLLGDWASPFVMRTRIALNLKGVNYEFLEEVPGKKSDLLVQSNPIYKKIPVFLHAGRAICESMIIVEYIDEVWAYGSAILPSDPIDRATARFWAAYLDDMWFSSVLGKIIRGQTKEQEVEAKEHLIAGLQLLENAFVNCSKGKVFFGGDSIGYLDIALGCFLAWFRVVEELLGIKLLDKEKVPHLVIWSDHFCSNNFVKELMQEKEELLGFAKMLQTMWKASSSRS